MPRLFVLNTLVGEFKGSPMPEPMFTSSSISSGFLHTSLDEVNETVIGIGSFRHSVRKWKAHPIVTRQAIAGGWLRPAITGHAVGRPCWCWKWDYLAHRSSAIKCPGDLVTCKFLWGVSWKNPARSGILTLFLNCHKLTPYDPNIKFPSTLSTFHFQQFPSLCKATYSPSYLQHYQLTICWQCLKQSSPVVTMRQ